LPLVLDLVQKETCGDTLFTNYCEQTTHLAYIKQNALLFVDNKCE